ncbi:MAG: META domain-containing protein [Chloroflexi bacterium]|nr:META domain-containing protein [Chloroflexota bacterium]
MTHTIQIKKQFGLIVMALLALTIIVACTPTGGTEPSAQPEQVTMYVGSETVECVGVGPQICLLVKFDKETEWEFFYDGIAGFEHEPGFEYELLVTKTEIENPPADASSIQYELVEVVSKTAVDGAVGLSNPASVYCEDQDGKLEIRTDDEGNQVGICVFEDDSECEEWAFYRDECQPGQTDSLVGINWNLVTYGDQTPLPDAVPTIQFSEDGISGSSGCNSYSGGYTLDGTALTIGEMLITLMACEGLMEQEAIFTQMLQAAESITLDGEMLTIHTTEGDLVFEQAAHLDLVGTNWVLSGIAQDEAIGSTAIDSEITAVFQDGQMTGSAGCNNYFASYEADDAFLTLGSIGSAKMLCEDEKNQREMEFLTALEGIAGYSISRGTLMLTNVDGSTLIIFQAQEIME